MHLALRRYAEPPRGFLRFFGVGLLTGLLALTVITDLIARSR